VPFEAEPFLAPAALRPLAMSPPQETLHSNTLTGMPHTLDPRGEGCALRELGSWGRVLYLNIQVVERASPAFKKGAVEFRVYSALSTLNSALAC
jgi:hypothetical protein